VEVGENTKVRHDSEDSCTAMLSATYSAPLFLCARISSDFGFTGGRLLIPSSGGLQRSLMALEIGKGVVHT